MAGSIDLSGRLVTALEDMLPIQQEDDGALTVHHHGTFASLRVVTIAQDLDLVSLTQVLAWDLPLNGTIRASVAKHANNTLLGTVSLVEKISSQKVVSNKPGVGQGRPRKTGDVLLRYNFPAAGLTDDALRTLILMVLATGADVRRELVS